jgi:hypothetical protein
MGDVVEIRGKTEQRVATIISVLRDGRHGSALTYEDLENLTGADYGTLLYVCATLTELGHVERVPEADVEGRPPGRPVVRFRWVRGRSRSAAHGR